MGGIGPTMGNVAQQIPGISNRIGKTADPATRFPIFQRVRHGRSGPGDRAFAARSGGEA